MSSASEFATRFIFLEGAGFRGVPFNFDGLLFPSPFVKYAEYSTTGQRFSHRRLEEIGKEPGFIPLGLLGGPDVWLGRRGQEAYGPKLAPLKRALDTSPRLRVLLDYSWESGNYPSFFDDIDEFIQSMGVEPARCLLLVSNPGIESRFSQYLVTRQKTAASSYRVAGYDLFLMYSALEFGHRVHDAGNATIVSPAEVDAIRGRHRAHKFLSLNRRPRWHRFLLALMLVKAGLRNQGLVSMPSLAYKSDWTSQEHLMPDRVGSMAVELRDSLLALRNDAYATLPWTIDVEVDSGHTSHFAFDQIQRRVYLESYVQIVTESYMEGDVSDFFVTEKVCKPIVNLQPFLLFGGYRTLSRLAELGFEVGPMNAGYDREFDIAKRLELLYREIELLAGTTIGDLHELYYGSLDALLHNRARLFEMPEILKCAVAYRLHMELES